MSEPGRLENKGFATTNQDLGGLEYE